MGSDGEEISNEIDKTLEEELAVRKSQKKVHWKETGVDGKVVNGERVEKPEGSIGQELAEELWEDAGIKAREPKVRTRKPPGTPAWRRDGGMRPPTRTTRIGVDTV